MKRRKLLRVCYMGLVLIIFYLPILLVISYSFNDSRINSWSGFTLRWYADLFRDRTLFPALRNSLILALLASLSAAFIGALGAVSLGRAPRDQIGAARLSLRRTLEYLSILPIMIPEIIMGMVFLAFFSLLALPPGMLTLVIAHTSFCVPYVYLLVRARLAGLDKSCVEAAKDLGAGEWRAFFDITLPLILPAVLSGMLLSFAMSFDDVIISVFVTGVNTNTLPIRIYSQMKTGLTPKTNALCTLLFAATIILGLISVYLGRPKKVYRTYRRTRIQSSKRSTE
jgi:spermidine/putrescine transport system permease protein